MFNLFSAQHLTCLKNPLQKSRTFFRSLFQSKSPQSLECIEQQLLLADVGVPATQSILKELEQARLSSPDELSHLLKKVLIHRLSLVEHPFILPPDHPPKMILVVGVNGVGKTTLVAKLAYHFHQQGKKTLLAAGDTFRAAAIEQLRVWSERIPCSLIAQQPGADSSAVLYDAWKSAEAKSYDILIADTAGRLHTQNHLMVELQKIKRTLGKLDTAIPHEILLVLDAGIGQNALQQARQFHQALGVTGLAVTKLDGSAKGGMVFAISEELKLPIRWIGTGENLEDLYPFNATLFVQALTE